MILILINQKICLVQRFINGKPTKNKVIWRSIVNVNNAKAAMKKLSKINVFYKSIQDKSVDDVAKQVIEVTNNTTSKMLDKATANDVAGFQSYTIRGLDNKMSTVSDIEQYKLLNVKKILSITDKSFLT